MYLHSLYKLCIYQKSKCVIHFPRESRVTFDVNLSCSSAYWPQSTLVEAIFVSSYFFTIYVRWMRPLITLDHVKISSRLFRWQWIENGSWRDGSQVASRKLQEIAKSEEWRPTRRLKWVSNWFWRLHAIKIWSFDFGTANVEKKFHWIKRHDFH